MISKTKIVETSLVLTTGFLVLNLVFKNPVLVYIAISLGLIGIFVPPVARYMAIGWFKLADGLNFVVSKVILGVVYFIILFPIAFMYKAVGNRKLKVSSNTETNWIVRNKTYRVADIENIW
jgi:hypothetical protein